MRLKLSAFFSVFLFPAYLSVYAQELQCLNQASGRCLSARNALIRLEKQVDKAETKVAKEDELLSQIKERCAPDLVLSPNQTVWCIKQKKRREKSLKRFELSLERLSQRISKQDQKISSVCNQLCEEQSYETILPTPIPSGQEGEAPAGSRYTFSLGSTLPNGANFGVALDLSPAGVAVIGAPRDRENGYVSGAAYVLSDPDQNGVYTKLTRLVSEASGNNAEFGGKVKISEDGNVIAVSQLNTESVYVFRREGDAWVRSSRIRASNYYPSNHFGTDLALSEDGALLFVGAPSDDNAREDGGGSLENSGSVHVFRRIGDEWIQIRILKEPNPAKFTVCGGSLAYARGVLIMGCPYARPANGHQGWAHVFRVEDLSITHQQKLELPSGQAGGYFGFSVDTDGERLVIGASRDAALNAGRVYVYDQNFEGSFVLSQALESTLPAQPSYFGWSVSISGDRIAVGMPDARSDFHSQGLVQTFIQSNGSWIAENQLAATNAAAYEKLGYALSMAGNKLIVGVPFRAGGLIEVLTLN